MYDRILFPTDGSETATEVFEYALEIAGAHDATVYVLNVADTTQDNVKQIPGKMIDALEREGERIVDEIASRTADQDVTVITDVLQGRPYETIVDYADSSDIDLIVMPTYGRSGLVRFLLGSVTERVVNTATTPVLTVTPDVVDNSRFTYPSESVLVPTDGSQGANLALEKGIDLANASNATLHLLHVVETANLGIDIRSAEASDEVQEHANTILEEARETASAASVDGITTSVAYGRPFREIISYVDENDIDVIVLGTRGKTDFSRYSFGSVSAKLIRTSPVPVLMVRDAGSNDSGAAE